MSSPGKIMDVSPQAIVTMAVDGGDYNGRLSSYVLHDCVIFKIERLESRARLYLSKLSFI